MDDKVKNASVELRKLYDDVWLDSSPYYMSIEHAIEDIERLEKAYPGSRYRLVLREITDTVINYEGGSDRGFCIQPYAQLHR